jgi:dTDP-glucose 4,6-dehydratase
MVYGIDKCTYVANRGLLEEFGQYDNFTFLEKDIKDLDHLYDCDYIINTAAESHVGNSIIDSEDFISSNIMGVRNLLDLVRNKPINCNRRPIMFHFSTDEVYGDIVEGEHTEEHLLHPSNPYSAAKAAADMLVLAWARTYNIEYIILRPTNNYGIGQYPEKLIPLSVKNMMRGLKIRLHNNGTPIRNWLHADDTAEAVMAIIDSNNGTPIRNWLHADDTAEAVMAIIDSGNINEIYNVAGGFEQTNAETVRKIITAHHSTDNWEQYVDFSYSRQGQDVRQYVDFSYSRQGQDVRYALNDDKLRSLGWKPKKIFDEEIASIVEHYKTNFIW